jgi:acetyl/propionyl-CoA carboxylase alpha subunit
VETWVERGSEVPPFYDPMLAKIIVTGRRPRHRAGKMHRRWPTPRVSGIEPTWPTCARSWPTMFSPKAARPRAI